MLSDNIVQHQTPVSDNEPKAPYHCFISLPLSQKKEGSLAHKVYRGGEGEDNGVGQAVQKKFLLAGKQTTEKLSC